MPADPTAAAFFDVDNTVMQGASIFHLARGLHRREFFTTREILGAAWKQAYFRIVGVEDPEHVAERAQLGARLHRRAHGRRSSRSWARRSSTRRWRTGSGPAPARSPSCTSTRASGSGWSPRPRSRSRQIIARRLGLTGAMGTVAEHVDGVYTGRLVGDMLHGPAKAEAVRALAGAGGARPGPLLGVLRLLQRPADALAGRRPVRDQPRRPAARARPRATAGGSATTAPAARRRGPAWSRRPRPGR